MTALCKSVLITLHSDRLTSAVVVVVAVPRQDLFGKTCAGMRLLYERGVVKHRSQSELDEMRQKGGRTWVNSVANSVFALDKRYNPASEHPYLKHAPFVSEPRASFASERLPPM
eukprot:COSAG04_NODE_13352_length_609_cov_3.094118_1_plen_113_part_10